MLASTILRFAAVLVAAAPAVHAWGAPAPQPSHTSCTYSCPGQDQGNYSVHQPSCGHESTGMVCSYPTKNPGPFGFNRDSTCTYDESTGHLTSDKDSGYCPRTAQQECRPTWKREEGDLHVARAPQPSIPDSMKARHVINKRAVNRL